MFPKEEDEPQEQEVVEEMTPSEIAAYEIELKEFLEGIAAEEGFEDPKDE